MPGVYRIPCVYGVSYIGQTGKTVAERCKEHLRIQLGYPNKSALTEHSLVKDHESLFALTTVLAMSSFHGKCIVQEALEIHST